MNFERNGEGIRKKGINKGMDKGMKIIYCENTHNILYPG
jgi:hypothetical protein